MDNESRWKSFEFKSLEAGAHIHLIGICGTAMASLAGILKEKGFRVTGSDQNAYPPMSDQLREIGIDIMEGYSRENLSECPDLVIVGNVITRKHEEAQALLESDIPFTSLPVAMGEFVIEDRKSIVISGTHGKTTTTSLMAWMAQVCSFDPGYLIGGIAKNFSKSFAAPRGDLFVTEGDEYDTAFFDKVPKFVHYKPKFVILTSIEFDHADIYSDLQQIENEFLKLIRLIPEDGVLVANGDSDVIRRLIKECKGKVVTYGSANADYIYGRRSGGLTISHASNSIDCQFDLYGEYNRQNATAAFALASEMGWPQDSILQAMASFSGVKRRQEIIGRPGGVTVIEDFAHHPTAVEMTIDAVQDHYQGSRVISVFEPRSATSRRKVFQNEYLKAFSRAQKLFIAKPFNQSNIAVDDRFSSQELVDGLVKLDVDVSEFEAVDNLVQILKSECRSGDVILIMSNGGFDGLYSKLLQELSDT